MIIKIEIIHDDTRKESEFKAFKGDELTSAVSEAILLLQELQQREMVV
jgi:hypothetical protein